MIANLTWMAGVSYGVLMDPYVAVLLHSLGTYSQHRCVIILASLRPSSCLRVAIIQLCIYFIFGTMVIKLNTKFLI